MGNAQGSAPKSDVLKHIELLEGKYKVPVVAFTPPKFEPGDPAALAYLDEHGYVVFGGAASPDEAKQSVDMFWTHLETETGGKIKRADPSTWIDENGFPGGGFGGVGIMTTMAIGHAAWLWHLRGLPRVVKAFETIWGTEDLLTSFDGGGVFRPPEINELWATRDGWFHVDKNWRHKPTRVSVQGLVNLLPSGPADGGLVVVPQSHKVFEILAKEQPDAAPSSNRDFVRMTERDIPELWARGAYKLCLAPGDLALWDSRTTHCNHPATRQLSRARQGQVELRRLVGYICMTPTSFAKDREAHIKRRVQGFQQAQTTTHWPHDYQATSAPYKSKTFALPALNDLQRQILVGKGSDIDVTKPIVVDRDP